MSYEKSDSEALIQALAGEARADLPRRPAGARADSTEEAGAGAHPEPDLLFEYHAGILSPEAEEDLRHHLLACRRCTRLLLELEPFAAAAEATSDGPADLRAAAGWRDFRERASGTARRSSSLRKHLPSVAAALLIVGLAGWNLKLGHERRVMLAAEPGVLTGVAPSPSGIQFDSVRSTDMSAPEVIEFSRDEPLPMFDLYDVDSGFETYEIQVLDAKNRVVWSERPLLPPRNDGWVVRIERHIIPAGKYLFRVIGNPDSYRGATKGTTGDSRDLEKDELGVFEKEVEIRYR